jgi:hypothetical protein
MSVDDGPAMSDRRAAAGRGRPADGSASRPSKNNRHGPIESLNRPNLDPDDLPGGTGLRPLSVEPGRRLRDEAILDVSDGPQARR